jgi:excisionase family DNA binding protein
MAPEPTRPIYVRMPPLLADKLDRAAERLGASKRDVLAALVSDHLDTDGENFVLHPGGKRGRGRTGGASRSPWSEQVDPVDGTGTGAADRSDQHNGPDGSARSDAEVLTAADVAALLRVAEPDVVELAAAGELPARQIGPEWRFARSAVLRWLQGAA